MLMLVMAGNGDTMAATANTTACAICVPTMLGPAPDSVWDMRTWTR